jgi:hypothetical protein
MSFPCQLAFQRGAAIDLWTMKISCDQCGAAFEAADDQDLCAACRDAAEIGDPYRATLAVMDGAPVPADSASRRIPPPPEEFPNLWGIRSLRRVVPEAFRLWRSLLPAMIAIGFACGLVGSVSGVALALLRRGGVLATTSGSYGGVALPSAFQMWELLVRMPLTVFGVSLILAIAAQRSAREIQPRSPGAAVGLVRSRYWRALGASTIFYSVTVLFTLVGGALDVAIFGSRAPEGGAGLASRVLWFATLVPTAVVTLFWEMSTCAALFERARPLPALRRSSVLARQRLLPTAALIALAYAVVRLPLIVLGEAAPDLDVVWMEGARLAWITATFGFCNVLVFALYAALRDRELARAGTED